MAQVPHIERVYKLLTARGVAPGRVYIYILVTADLGEAERRINALRHLKSITIKTQAERNPRQGLEPNAAQKKFATEYGYRQLWRRETWTDYCNRLGFFY
jgi:hypothetical protein